MNVCTFVLDVIVDNVKILTGKQTQARSSTTALQSFSSGIKSLAEHL